MSSSRRNSAWCASKSWPGGISHDRIAGDLQSINISTTIEGRERYPINIRYPRELRDDVDELSRTLVSVPTNGGIGGSQIPLGQLASIRLVEGPSMIAMRTGASPDTSTSTPRNTTSAVT